MTEQAGRRELEDAPRLVSGLFQTILQRLDDGAKTMSELKQEMVGLRFEVARLKEQVTFANGRTGKIEDRLARVDIDEVPALRVAFEEMEGNLEAMRLDHAAERAKLQGRADQRAEDRAKLGFIWEFMGKELWKYALVATASAAGMGIAGVMGWLS